MTEIMEQEPQVSVIAADLTKRTVFLQLHFSMLGAERTSQGTEQDIKTEADKAILRVKKRLFVSPEYKAIMSANGKLRRQIDKLCIQGALEGVRTIPNGNAGRVFKMCTMHKVLIDGLVDKFALVYPQLYEQAKLLLGPLFRSDEYPTPANVKNAFSFRYCYVTFDVPEQLKSVDGEMFKMLQGQKQEIMKSAAEEINSVRRATFGKLVEVLKDELSPGAEGAEKKFHKSAITKIQKFVDEYDIMDVTTDEELKALKSKAQKLIGGITVENIRSSEEFKTKLLSEVSNLSELLKPLVQEKGRALKVVV